MLIGFKCRKYRISLESFILQIIFNILKSVSMEHKYIHFQGRFLMAQVSAKHIREIYLIS